MTLYRTHRDHVREHYAEQLHSPQLSLFYSSGRPLPPLLRHILDRQQNEGMPGL
jgi:hypothetical protein